tara:strand:- start:2625 stop:3095 length:471 start_codon:yes stop_codon:yes gene_type:complete
MINNFEEYLTLENIFLFSNWGVIPFWLLILFSPNSSFTRFLVHSIIIPLMLGIAYIFIAYQIYLGDNLLDGFGLYLGLENLYAVFSDEKFLLIFWLHFLSISLFTGAWIARDSTRYSIPRSLTSLSLITTYFTGPLGIFLYWVIRIFFAKKISLNE